METKDAVSPIIEERRLGEEMKPAVAIREVRPPVVEIKLGEEMKPAVAVNRVRPPVVEIRDAVDT